MKALKTDIKSVIGDNVRALRKKNRTTRTQQKCAKNTILKLSTLSKIERGITDPQLSTLSKIAKVFNISLIDLFSRKPIDENDMNTWRYTDEDYEKIPDDDKWIKYALKDNECHQFICSGIDMRKKICCVARQIRADFSPNELQNIAKVFGYNPNDKNSTRICLYLSKKYLEHRENQKPRSLYKDT